MVNKLLIGTVITLLATSCSGFKRVQKHAAMDITPSPMELSAIDNNVDVDYAIDVPRKFIKNGHQLIFSPEITNGSNTAELTDVVINGKRFERRELRAIKKGKFSPNLNVVKVVTDKEPLRVTVDDNIRFQPWMENSLLVGHTYYNNGRKTKHVFEQIMAEGIEYTPEVVIVEPPVVIEEAKTLKMSDNAAIYFKINSAEIMNCLDNNNVNMMTITNLLNQINNNKDANLKGITIVGVASPDGTYEFNDKLSKERAMAAKDYLVQKCKIKPRMIKIDNIAEDWAGLTKLLKNSSISDRNTLISMINSQKTDTQKNAILKQSPNFRVIARDMLPKLRRTIYKVNFTQLSTGEIIVVPVEVLDL